MQNLLFGVCWSAGRNASATIHVISQIVTIEDPSAIEPAWYLSLSLSQIEPVKEPHNKVGAKP